MYDGTVCKRELGPFNIQSIYNLIHHYNSIGIKPGSRMQREPDLSKPVCL